MSTELDVLDPALEKLELTTGFTVAFEHLKTRQFFRLLRIITHGAGSALLRQDGLFGGSSEEMVQRLVAMLVLSIPDAEDETLEFLTSMLKPADLLTSDNLDKVTEARNEGLWKQLRVELFNPEPEDVLQMIDIIIRRESKDLQALGKRVRLMLEVAQKTGQVAQPKKTAKKPTKTVSSVDSVEPSI